MTQPERSDSDRFELAIFPAGTGWRVTVMDASRYGVASTIENSPFEAAAIGVGLWHRYKALRDATE